MASGYPTGKSPHQWEPKDPWSKYPQTASVSLPKPATLADVFNNQFFLGFQDQINRWNTLTGTKLTTFPPYNLIKVDKDHYMVEIAIAGYGKDDVEISVEKDLLTVKSVEKQEERPEEMLHQGIAKRQWTQQFVLGEWMVVKDATLQDGLLTINVEREVPEEMKPRVVAIQ